MKIAGVITVLVVFFVMLGIEFDMHFSLQEAREQTERAESERDMMRIELMKATEKASLAGSKEIQVDTLYLKDLPDVQIRVYGEMKPGAVVD